MGDYTTVLMQKLPFDELFEYFVVRPSTTYRQAIGEPVNLDEANFSNLLSRLGDFQTYYPGMAFWQIIQYKTLTILTGGGDVDIFGRKLESVKDFVRTISRDYQLPYFRWRAAAYELIFRQGIPSEPLQVGYRQTIPLKARDGETYWFTMHSTISQIDANGRIVTNLQTFYLDGKWSARNLRPFEASIYIRNFANSALDQELKDQLSLSLIDEFTNAELDLLSLYASGKTVDEILKARSWTRHTLHEYNANLLKKAKNLFVYDFRNAREFAEYCLEKGFIRTR